MHKIDKFLAKLSRKERDRLEPAITAITLYDMRGLDLVKLKDHENEYRVRVGPFRIFFTKFDHANIITDIQFRNDNTY